MPCVQPKPSSVEEKINKSVKEFQDKPARINKVGVVVVPIYHQTSPFGKTGPTPRQTGSDLQRV